MASHPTLTTSTPTGATGPGKPRVTGPSTSLPGVGPSTLPAAGGDDTEAATQAVSDSAPIVSGGSGRAQDQESQAAPQAAASPDEAQRVRVDTSTLKGRFNQAQATLGRNSTGIGDAGAARNEAAIAAESQGEANAAEASADNVISREGGLSGLAGPKPSITGPSTSFPGTTAISNAGQRLAEQEAKQSLRTENRFNAQSTDSQNSF